MSTFSFPKITDRSMTALMFVFIKDLVPSIDLRPAHTQKHISSNSDLLLSLKLNRTSLFIDGVGVPLYSRYAFLYSLSVTEGLPTVISKLPAATRSEEHTSELQSLMR